MQSVCDWSALLIFICRMMQGIDRIFGQIIESGLHFFISLLSQLNQGKGLALPGPDMLQRHLQQKSAEINALPQNMQSLITYQKTVSPWKVKPQQSLISQMERRWLPMKQPLSAKKTP